MKIKPLFLLALVLLTAAPRLAVAEDAAAEQEIAKLREGLVDSFNHGDIDRLLTYLDTNAVVTWQNGEVCEGTAAVKDYYDRMMTGSNRVVLKVTSDPKVLGRHIQGDWCVSWGELNDHFQLADGRDLPLNSKFTATIAKRGDRWLVSAFHVSVNAFDNPITQLAVKKTAQVVGVVGVIFGCLLTLVVVRLLRPKQPAK